MKKIITLLILLVTSSVGVVFATDAGTSTKVIVTEILPGMTNCKCLREGTDSDGATSTYTSDALDAADPKCGTPQTRKYECTIEQGFGSFTSIMGGIIKWLIYVGYALSVLGVTLFGIAYTVMGKDSDQAKHLKTWLTNIAIGFIVLFFFQQILVILAPWVFQ